MYVRTYVGTRHDVLGIHALFTSIQLKMYVRTVRMLE